MGTLFSPARLARRSARHPWLTLGVWVLLVAAGIAAAGLMKIQTNSTMPGTDSAEAQQLLEDHLRGPEPVRETVIVTHPELTADRELYRTYVEGLVSELRALNGTVAHVVDYYESGDQSLVSSDGHRVIIPVILTGKQEDAKKTVEPVLETLAGRHDAAGFTLQTVGDGSLNKALGERFESDLSRAELIGIPAALVVLVIVFGAAVAAGVPVILSLLGIALAMGITGAMSRLAGVGDVAMNVLTMIGLAVGIDYTLFIVERFREERTAGRPKVEAIVAAGDTASRAVLFSGATVIIALAGMLIVPGEFRGLAIGAIAAVIGAVGVALTLLPALLSLLGDKVNWLRLPGRKPKQTADLGAGFFGKTTSIVMRHPVISVTVSSALLIGAALPYFAINLGTPGLRDFPADLPPVQAYKILDQEFSAGRIAPTHIVIKGDMRSENLSAAVERLRSELAIDPSFTAMGQLETNADSSVGSIDVILQGDSQGPAALDAIGRLRNTYIPSAFKGVDARVLVGGSSAGAVDYINSMNHYLPIVITFVLALSFVLLMMVFRSIVIPIKAILMNLLSVGAAYGLLVLVFQEGVGADLLGFQQSDSIAAFIPIFLFGILFGLSMDYHVFLLSRIQERYMKTGDNAEAVAYGLRSTAHIITGAAAIMMVVFSGFAMGDMLPLQQTGFGLAVAVFIDATVVRSVLVPASMELLGARNWYLPSWLEWLPKITVEGGYAEQDRPAPAPAHHPVLGYTTVPTD